MQNVIIQAGLLVGGLLCAYQVTQGQKTVGDFVLYLAYILQLYQPLNDFGSYYKSIQKNLVDMEKMLDLMHEPVEVKDPIKPTPLNVEKGEIEFRNVTFAYDERNPILKNVSFRVPSGQTVAIVGPSGGGKVSNKNSSYRVISTHWSAYRLSGIMFWWCKARHLILANFWEITCLFFLFSV